MTYAMTALAARGHRHSHGPFDSIISWVAHAAVWRLIWRLPTPVLIVVGMVAAVLFITRRRK